MKRIDGVVGNVDDDPELADRIADHERAGTLERAVLDPGDRKKSRLRVETDAGTDLGVVVDRPELRPGDVLAVEEERAIVVAFASREAIVVDLPEATPETLAAAVTFGHRIGNQHWDLAVEDGTVYVPRSADRHIVENVLADALPPGTGIRYESVPATRWFDDGDGADHAHESSAGGHSHVPEGGHGHAPADHDHHGNDDGHE